MLAHSPPVAPDARRLELFGSAARGDFDPQAGDLDFFVEFEPAGWKGSFRRFMGLKLTNCWKTCG